MDEKNRFSLLLERLMAAANVKNIVLANALQYDVSYISKWLNGRSIPSKKGAEQILSDISYCIVNELDDEGRENLYQEYEVDNPEDLQQAIYDNLEVEYDYVSGLKNSIGSYVAPQTSYFSSLSLAEFISRMQHPALRKVKSLDVVATMDILSVRREYRLMMMQIDQRYMKKEWDFPKVRFSMIINLEVGERDCFHDCIFLMNVLTNGSYIDLQLYESSRAYGKIVFAAKDAYAISGMLFDPDTCVAVMISEKEDIRDALYRKAQSLCSRENLLFQRVKMRDMITGDKYIQALMSQNIRLLIGRASEYFVPPELFEELLENNPPDDEWALVIPQVRKINQLMQRLFEKSDMQIMIYESVFFNFSISGELDFFNYKVILSAEQRLKYLTYMVNLFENNPNLSVKMALRNFATDYRYRINPCVFLSDRISYIRVENRKYHNNIMMFNHTSVKKMFDQFYAQIWEMDEDNLISDRTQICKSMNHLIKSLKILGEVE